MKWPRVEESRWKWWQPLAVRMYLRRHMKPVPPDEAVKKKGFFAVLYLASCLYIFHYVVYKCGGFSRKEDALESALIHTNDCKIITLENFKVKKVMDFRGEDFEDKYVKTNKPRAILEEPSTTIDDATQKLPSPLPLPQLSILSPRQFPNGGGNGNIGFNGGTVSTIGFPNTIQGAGLNVFSRVTELVADSLVRAIGGIASLMNILQIYAQTGTLQLGNLSSSAQVITGRLLNMGANAATSLLQELSNDIGGSGAATTGFATTADGSLFSATNTPVGQLGLGGRQFNFGGTALPGGLFGWNTLPNTNTVPGSIGQGIGSLTSRIQSTGNGLLASPTSASTDGDVSSLIRTMFAPLVALSAGGTGPGPDSGELAGSLLGSSSIDSA